MISRDECEVLDRRDPLAFTRDRFVIPDGVIYLDGNSLGALPRTTAPRVRHVIEQEWGTGLIRSWNAAGWMEMTQGVGVPLAALLGCQASEVLAVESTTMALYKAVGAALELQRRRAPERAVVLTESGNFPTDAHVLGALREQHGIDVRAVRAADLPSAMTTDVSVVVLTHVNYRTGALHDMSAITAAAHSVGALVVWDLAHSSGAVPLALNADDVDFAVGCGYKFLNGGPGAPAHLFIADGLQGDVRNPLPGWLGTANPFLMSEVHDPAPGIAQFISGTPGVLALAAFEEGLATFEGVEMVDVYGKARSLVELFAALVAERLPGSGLVPARSATDGPGASQLSFHHEHAFAIVQALVARGVIGDFREPDIARFGIAPLYLRAVDIWDAVDHLVCVFEAREFEREEFTVRAAVT